jgi:peptidoglycan/LPS O-acetylase OafA/YrhL
VSFVLTLILCWFFYRFIEMKTERFRESLYQKSKQAALERTPSAVRAMGPSATTLN